MRQKRNSQNKEEKKEMIRRQSHSIFACVKSTGPLGQTIGARTVYAYREYYQN